MWVEKTIFALSAMRVKLHVMFCWLLVMILGRSPNAQHNIVFCMVNHDHSMVDNVLLEWMMSLVFIEAIFLNISRIF